MISRTWSRKSIAFCVAVAVLSLYSMVALATPGQKASGELSVSGQVTVNGQAAISGATVFSDSVITTAANSSATISLGKLGRVELLPNSSAKLSFSEGNISASLDAGRIGNTIVASQGGSVELRAGGGTKAVAAGTSESAGTPQPGTRCTRLTKTETFGHLSGGALIALLAAAGGAIAAAIIAATHNNNLNFGGSVTVVSPTR